MNNRIENIIRKTFNQLKVKRNPSCYFYDLRDIDKKINNVKKYAPVNFSLYYAMKANPNQKILEFIAGQQFVKGLEIASVGELKKARNFYTGNRIIFTGPGKTSYELEQSIEHQIRLINAESLVEIHRINQMAKDKKLPKVDILLRINTDYLIGCASDLMTGRSTKMGIDEKDACYTMMQIMTMDHVNIKGVHVYPASGVQDYQELIQYDRYVFGLIKDLEQKTGMKIEIIDLGGGIGIDYTPEKKQFNLAAYFSTLNDLINTFEFQDKEIIMELGRYIVGECGYFASEIIDIKQIKGKKHIILAGGINHMGLSRDLGSNIPTHIIPRGIPPFFNTQCCVENEVADISGPLCDTKDKISWGKHIDKAEIGDIVVFLQAGAYSYTLSCREFLSHEYPFEFAIK